jgi:hypothetical protein
VAAGQQGAWRTVQRLVTLQVGTNGSFLNMDAA